MYRSVHALYDKIHSGGSDEVTFKELHEVYFLRSQVALVCRQAQLLHGCNSCFIIKKGNPNLVYSKPMPSPQRRSISKYSL